eukprot:scaffold5429_cov32-Tisochrysis_lutea.AAC.4
MDEVSITEGVADEMECVMVTSRSCAYASGSTSRSSMLLTVGRRSSLVTGHSAQGIVGRLQLFVLRVGVRPRESLHDLRCFVRSSHVYMVSGYGVRSRG